MSEALFTCVRCGKDRPASVIRNDGRCEPCVTQRNYDEHGEHYEYRRRRALAEIVEKVGHRCSRCGKGKVQALTVKYRMSHRKWFRIARATEVALKTADVIERDYELLCPDDRKHRYREELGRLA